jgi:predicted MFS family arabinose efflux permease
MIFPLKLRRRYKAKLMHIPAAFAPLRETEFRRYYLGQLVSVLGTWMQAIALPWLAYTISGQMLLPPFAGVLGDFVNKRKLLIALYLTQMVPVVILATLTYLGKVEIWHIMVLATVIGLCSGVEMPIRWASFSEMLKDKTLLPNAIALNAAALNLGRVLGPAIGGALIAWVGESACFAINAISFLAVVSQLARASWGDVAPRTERAQVWESFKAGGRAAFGDPFVRLSLITVSIISFALGNYSTVMPVFAKDVLKGDAQTLGALMSCMGIGALASTIYLATRKGRGLPQLVIFASITGGISYLLLGLTRSLSMAPLLMIGVGMGMILTFASINTMIQLRVDASVRARVMGFYSWAVMGLAPASAFVAGSLIDLIGAPKTVMFAGALSVVGGLFFARGTRKLSA